jgi:membrane peptidoglycan carboxypeptidase
MRMSPCGSASCKRTRSSGRVVIDGPVVTADGISAQTSKDLRRMMREAITDGTASTVMSGVGPDSGARTGSAEAAGKDTTDGWFTGYAGNIAAAAIA